MSRNPYDRIGMDREDIGSRHDLREGPRKFWTAQNLRGSSRQRQFCVAPRDQSGRLRGAVLTLECDLTTPPRFRHEQYWCPRGAGGLVATPPPPSAMWHHCACAFKHRGNLSPAQPPPPPHPITYDAQSYQIPNFFSHFPYTPAVGASAEAMSTASECGWRGGDMIIIFNKEFLVDPGEFFFTTLDSPQPTPPLACHHGRAPPSSLATCLRRA